MGRGAGPTAQSLSFPTVAAAIRIAASYELKMRGARWLSTTAAILAVAALLWLARMSDSWRTSFSFTGRQVDYYNLLVHGFRQGHLYMDSDPDPALYSTDPDTRRRASYLQDASLFNHRYYLYYGVVPAALLFLPYSLATGGDLSAALPVGWLASVWAPGLAVVGGRLVVEVTGGSWPVLQVRSVSQPGREPEPGTATRRRRGWTVAA